MKARNVLISGKYNMKWYYAVSVEARLMRFKCFSPLFLMRDKLKKNSKHSNRKSALYIGQGPKIAYSVTNTLKSNGIDSWLYAGSLLGAIREGDFLPWDTDLDLLIIADSSFNWTAMEKALTASGFTKVREYLCNERITEQTYAMDDQSSLTLDIFSVEPTGNGKGVLFAYGRRLGVNYKNALDVSVLRLDTHIPSGTDTVNIRGWELPVPSNAEQLLLDNYGAGWRTPDPTYKDAGTFTVDSDLQGFISMHLK